MFVLVGGVFAATEIALVSLRESQLTQLERQGSRGARVAAVARDPNRFLAAVQIGVTVAGFFSAAYGGSTLAPDLAPYLEVLSALGTRRAETVALVVMPLVIAYLSPGAQRTGTQAAGSGEVRRGCRWPLMALS